MHSKKTWTLWSRKDTIVCLSFSASHLQKVRSRIFQAVRSFKRQVGWWSYIMLQNEEIEEDRHHRKRKYQTRSCERSLQSDHSNHQQLKHRCSYDHPIKRKTVSVFKYDLCFGLQNRGIREQKRRKKQHAGRRTKPCTWIKLSFSTFFWRHYIYMNRARNLLT